MGEAQQNSNMEFLLTAVQEKTQMKSHIKPQGARKVMHRTVRFIGYSECLKSK